MEVEAFQRLDPENFYRKFIKSDVRPDGRKPRAVRPISIDTNVLSEKHVQASALVGLGSTKILAGISLQVGQPSENLPRCGALDVQVTLSPLTSPKFISGRPTEQGQALATFVKTSIVESGTILLADLAIDDGSCAWKLCMDLVCLSFDGSLADASLLAAMSALMCLRLPETEHVNDEIVIKDQGISKALLVHHVPVALSCGIFDGAILTDPSLLEEELVTTRITTVCTASGQVCGVYKPGGSSASGEQMSTCLQLCQQHAGHVQRTLEAAVELEDTRRTTQSMAPP